MGSYVLSIRRATRDDIGWLVKHRIEMFRSMGHTNEELEALKPVVIRFLNASWDDSLVCFLAVEDERVVGGCAVTLYKVMPGPRNPSGNVLYAHNMYVEPENRGKGVGSALLQKIIGFARTVGAQRIELHATQMGQGVYERAGFIKTENHYALRIE